jgi:hypothetical protein
MISPSFSTRARNEELIADSHDHATVLFVTVVSSPGAALDAAQSLARIDSLSCRFDSLVISRRMLKVEYVGNDYMVVSPFFDLPPAPDLTAADTARHGGDSDMCHCHSATLSPRDGDGRRRARRTRRLRAGAADRFGCGGGHGGGDWTESAVPPRAGRHGAAPAHKHTCVHTCIHVYIPIWINTCIHTLIHAGRQARPLFPMCATVPLVVFL